MISREVSVLAVAGRARAHATLVAAEGPGRIADGRAASRRPEILPTTSPGLGGCGSASSRVGQPIARGAKQLATGDRGPGTQAEIDVQTGNLVHPHAARLAVACTTIVSTRESNRDQRLGSRGDQGRVGRARGAIVAIVP